MPDDTPKAGYPDLPPLVEPDAEWSERFGGDVERDGRDVPGSPVRSDGAGEAVLPLARPNPVRPRSDLPSGEAVREAGAGPEAAKPNRNGRGRGKTRGGFEPPTTCPKCGEPLGTELQLEAFRILSEIGKKFDRQAKKNWREAFADLSHKVSGSLSVLVASRVVTLEAAIKLLVSIHTMLGQPKLNTPTEEGQSPLDQLSEWMNSENAADGLEFSPLEGKGEN